MENHSFLDKRELEVTYSNTALSDPA